MTSSSNISAAVDRLYNAKAIVEAGIVCAYSAEAGDQETQPSLIRVLETAAEIMSGAIQALDLEQVRLERAESPG